MDWTKTFEILKMGPRIWFVVFTTATVLLLSPARFLDTLALATILQGHRSWLGVEWIVSSATLVTHVLASADIPLRRKVVWLFVHRRRLHARLNDLTPAEQAFLRKYLKENTRTLEATLGNGVVAGLARERIIVRPSSVSSDCTEFAFNIEPWPWSHLRKHPELVGLP